MMVMIIMLMMICQSDCVSDRGSDCFEFLNQDFS